MSNFLQRLYYIKVCLKSLRNFLQILRNGNFIVYDSPYSEKLRSFMKRIKKPKIDDENLRKLLAQMTNQASLTYKLLDVSASKLNVNVNKFEMQFSCAWNCESDEIIEKSIDDIPNRNKFWNEETEGDKIVIRMNEMNDIFP
ncbi:hypothetical protein WUBG_07932 [Wuchereria bancrofti]|uniref:Uncharacterized protein n=1 Tax=Wuchereria bancrofti TaxID=6293 RepID=J9EVI9_WUCBA|nr:hypothetical protein WUBG_07932 [Wuchereria bancrofti]